MNEKERKIYFIKQENQEAIKIGDSITENIHKQVLYNKLDYLFNQLKN